ncbi:MAG TPA: hypothetical protein VHL59_18215 [Thermoanaerobaculia bacterium]|nr:hypothetical protein [Thermoanaerobaculia bacterium]
MTNDDWAAAEAEYMREERERLGGPPAPEEVVALLRGELSQEDAARVRALAVYYPALTDVLLGNAPAEDAAPSSPAEVAERWQSLQRRMEEPKPRTRGTAARWLPLVAMLIAGFFMGWIAHTFRRDEPRVFLARHELHPGDVRRGTAAEQRAHLLPADEDHYLLVLMLGRETDYGRYRIDIISTGKNPSEVVWRSPAVSRRENHPFTITIPRKFLDPGAYRLELHGLDGESHHLASYAVRVSR